MAGNESNDISDPFWLFRPGTSPLAVRVFYGAMIGLIMTLALLLGLLVYEDYPVDQIIHVCVMGFLALGLLASVSWVFSMVGDINTENPDAKKES